MNLKLLNPLDLDVKMKNLAARERELLAEILSVIKEIDSRKVYLEFGFSNLYAYLTEGIGYSAASAQRRIDAARLLREIPELIPQIESGEIHLGQISMVQKTVREVQKTRGLKVSVQDKKNLIQELVNINQRESQVKVAAFFDQPIRQETKEKFQSDESVRVELTLSKELYQKISRAQELVSHQLESKDLRVFLNYISDKIIQQKTLPSKSPKKIQEGRVRQEVSSLSSNSAAEVKSVPAYIQKQLFRHHQGCEFRNPQTGKKCGQRWHLQIDHRQAKWAGGGNQLDNLQLLCAAHNQAKYQREAGIRFKG